MKQSFFIPGLLPGTNEVVRKHWRVYANLKRECGITCSVYIHKAKMQPMQSCSIIFEWREKDWRRDGDNIQFGQKFILDALVTCGILKNDTRRFVEMSTHKITIDKANPGVLVTLSGLKIKT